MRRFLLSGRCILRMNGGKRMYGAVQLNKKILSAASLLEGSTMAAQPDMVLHSVEKSSVKPKKMIQVYEDFQLKFPSHFIFMQVGDFFEIYGEDAIRASKILDIGLTNAPNKISGGGPVAMTGVPVRSVETYVERFIKRGYSVVLCEQFGQAGKTGSGLRMERRVTRVITPGTVTEEGLLESGLNNFLLSITKDTSGYGLAWIDISTGFFRLGSCPTEDIADELVRINPREIIIDGSSDELTAIIGKLKISVQHLPAISYTGKQIGSIYEQIFSEADSPFDQSRLSSFGSGELQASTNLLQYVLQTQLDKRPYIEFPTVDDPKQTMRIDSASFKSLEILKSNGDDTDSSLLSTINHTLTAAGSRLLSRWLQSPSTDIAMIGRRQDLVEELIQHTDLLQTLRTLLQSCKDIERCYQRIALNRSSGGPRDMQLIRITLQEINELHSTLQKHISENETSGLTSISDKLESFDSLIGELVSALNDKLPFRVSEGGVIREGYSAKLDGLRSCTGNVRQARSLLENKYRNETGKQSLKIDEGKLLGYFIEVSRSEGLIAPEHASFQFDGQTDSKFRYRTAELNGLKDSSTVNEAKILAEESLIYESLRQMIVREGADIIQSAKALAELDVLCSFAYTAKLHNYNRPILSSDSHVYAVSGGRHPVVECMQASAGRPFTSNDCILSEKSFVLITGPNMGGKSTFLRQNALISILAQIGSFVPAASAHLGIVDSLFTRIGASDDLAKDRSTFMMEMMETSVILKHATSRSLVIMDEIGRGTAAEEGFALAWAIAQHLIQNIGCRTLFATHYYGISSLVESHHEKADCLQTTATDDGHGNLSFLHKLSPGVASHSYAIEIGRFAGLPHSLLHTARLKLSELRQKERELVDEDVKERSDDIVMNELKEMLKPETVESLAPRDCQAQLFRLSDIIYKR